MTKITLTRRQLAQAALTGAAVTLLPQSLPAQDTDTETATMPNDTSPAEGEALARTVPCNVGYALSDAQAKEVATALKDYPGPFAKARAYTISDDVAPAWAGDAPPARPGKERG